MRIAFITFEYASSGGIGTYVRQAAAMLSGRGHDVEVFTSSASLRDAGEVPGFRVYGVTSVRRDFPQTIIDLFADRHRFLPFDVVEGPEYKAEASGVAEAFPDLPLVVRAHGPTFTIEASNSSYVPWHARARYYAGALRRGRIPSSPWKYTPAVDPECAHARAADHVMANSRATADRITKTWDVRPDRLSTVPLVFNPPAHLLAMQTFTGNLRILFLGRIEVRKGVLELARAIPPVLAQFPQVVFQFVGRILPHPNDQLPLNEHILRIVGKRAASALEFTGSVPYAQVSKHLANADICVFPSDWEASGFVCMEAMAAGRGVVGSTSGGMAEIIEHGRTGLLVPPRAPRSIAEAILKLLRDPERRIAMGKAARSHILRAYAPDRIGPLQEASYQLGIECARKRCAYPASAENRQWK